MPWQEIPGAKGVKYRPAAETMADPNYEVITDEFGNVYAKEKSGWLGRNAPWLTAALMGAGFGANALGLLGSGGAAASQSAAAGGVLPSSQLPMSPLYTGPVVGGSQGISAAVGSAAGSAAGAAGAAAAKRATEAATDGLGGKALDWLKDPKNLAGLGGLVPLLMQAFQGGGGGQNAPEFAALNDEMSKNLALQRKRVEQTQPVFDTLVNMSYGSTPTRYRGAPPEGYPETAKAPVDGPYKYTSPRF